jgi:carbamate kinase
VRLVIAIGGNALLRRGERPDAGVQLEHVRVAAEALAPLAREHELLICHGNGPQVGLLALESASDPILSRPYPLDVLVAQTQGMIGYWLVQSLHNAGVAKPLVCLVTQVLVSSSDPAFADPTKFVGPIYTAEEATELKKRPGWILAADGTSWRRVVPSPEPREILEMETARTLLSTGSVVICGGGGGAPVVQDSGQLRGVEAVVDKDLTSALLAEAVHADRLLLLTDVPAVLRDYGTPAATSIRRVRIEEVAQMSFPAGSMGPKIEACRRFVQATGNAAAIGALEDAEQILAGTAGTILTR